MIQYEIIFSNNSTKLLLESWCWPKLQGIILYNRDPISRLLVIKVYWVIFWTKTLKRCLLLQNLIVSSDFDQKEQMSRDFIRLLGPYTEPVLIHQWAPGEHSFVVTFLWLNPYGELVNVTSVNIDGSALVCILI